MIRDADAIFHNERADNEIKNAQEVIKKRLKNEFEMREQDPFYFL